MLAVDGGGCAGTGNLYDTLDLAFSVADVFVDSIGFQGQPNFDQGDNVTFDVDFSSGSPASGILNVGNSGAGKSVDITLELYDAGSGDFISDIRIANEFIRANPATNFDNMYDFAVAAGSYRVDVRITDVGSENLLASDSATITVP